MIRKFSVTGQTALTLPDKPQTLDGQTGQRNSGEVKLYANSLESTENSIVNGHTELSIQRSSYLYPIGSENTSTDEGLSMSEDEEPLTPEHPEFTKMLNELDIDHKLMSAAQRGDTDKVRELLASGAQVITDETGTTAMHIASRSGFAEVIRLLLESGIDVDVPDSGGYTALHKAAAHGHLDVLELLINEGCDIDTQDDIYGNTPLHEAAWQGYSKSVDLLLKSKSNAFITNRAGCTALHLAAQNGHNQSGRTLLYGGCSPDVKNNYGDTPLHTAARYGHAGIARILISAKCSIDEQNKNGDTALHITAAFKRRKIAKLLVDTHTNIHLKNKQGESAVDIARRKENLEIIDIIHDTQTTSMPPHVKSYNHRPSFDKTLHDVKQDVLEPSPIDRNPKQIKEQKNKKHNAFVSWIRKVFTKPDKNGSSKLKSTKGAQTSCESADDTNTGLAGQYVKKPGFAYYRDLAGNVRQGPCGFVPACQCDPPDLDEFSGNKITYQNLNETRNILRGRIETLHRQTSQLNKQSSTDEANKPNMLTGLQPTTAAAENDITKQLALVESDLKELRGDLASWLQTQEDSTDHALPKENPPRENPLRENPFAYAVGKTQARFGDDFDHARMARYEMTEQFPPPPRLFRTRSDETLSHSEYSYHGRAFKSREAAMAELKTLKQHEEMRAKRKRIRAGIDDRATKQPSMEPNNNRKPTSSRDLWGSSENIPTRSLSNRDIPRSATTDGLVDKDRSSPFPRRGSTPSYNNLERNSSEKARTPAPSSHDSDIPEISKRVTPIGANETTPRICDEERAMPTYKLISEALKPTGQRDQKVNGVPLSKYPIQQRQNLYSENQYKFNTTANKPPDGPMRAYPVKTNQEQKNPTYIKPLTDTPTIQPIAQPRRVLPSYTDVQRSRGGQPQPNSNLYGSQQIQPQPRTRINLYTSEQKPNPYPRPLSPQSRQVNGTLPLRPTHNPQFNHPAPPHQLPRKNNTIYTKPEIQRQTSLKKPQDLPNQTNESCCSSSNPDSGYGGQSYEYYTSQTNGAQNTEYDSWYNQQLQDAARRMTTNSRSNRQMTSDV